MKLTLGWLKTHLETEASAEAVAGRLTMIGHEVEAVVDRGAALKDFVVAEVLAAEPHPNADKLRVCMVETGRGRVQVVCGAPNARAGMKGVFAAPGTRIPGLGVTLKAAAIRGVDSAGMLLSEREVALSDAHEGIIELPAEATVGRAGGGGDGACRSADRRRHHPQPRRLPRRPRAGPRSRRRRPRPAQAAGRLAGAGRVRKPHRRRARVRSRGCRRLSLFRRPLHPRRSQRRQPAVAAGPAARGGAAADLGPGRHHQLHDPRPLPAVARLRRRQGAGRPARAPCSRRRAAADAGRPRGRARPDDDGDRRRRRAGGPGRDHGRRSAAAAARRRPTCSSKPRCSIRSAPPPPGAS